jgi:hypothetical protein
VAYRIGSTVLAVNRPLNGQLLALLKRLDHVGDALPMTGLMEVRGGPANNRTTRLDVEDDSGEQGVLLVWALPAVHVPASAKVGQQASVVPPSAPFAAASTAPDCFAITLARIRL